MREAKIDHDVTLYVTAATEAEALDLAARMVTFDLHDPLVVEVEA